MNNTFTSCIPVCINICIKNNQNCTPETIGYSTADYFCLEHFGENVFHRSMARKPLPSLLGGGGIAISFFFCLHMHFLLDLF